MVMNAVSIFNYAKRRDGQMGSIWAQTRAHGCIYDQWWCQSLYGAYYQMPLNYLNDIGPMTFPQIGSTKDRPVGDQMRPPYFASILYFEDLYLIFHFVYVYTKSMFVLILFGGVF